MNRSDALSLSSLLPQSRAGGMDSRIGAPGAAGRGPSAAPRAGQAPAAAGAGAAAAAARPRPALGSSQGSQGSSLFGLLRAKSSQEGAGAGGGSFLSEDCMALAAGLRKVRLHLPRSLTLHLPVHLHQRNEQSVGGNASL